MQVAQRLSPLTGINELQLAIGLLTLGLALLAPVCSALWGAMINPNGPIAMICLGKGNTAANLLRMGGQLVGAALGSLLAITFVPVQHKGWVQHKILFGLMHFAEPADCTYPVQLTYTRRIMSTASRTSGSFTCFRASFKKALPWSGDLCARPLWSSC